MYVKHTTLEQLADATCDTSQSKRLLLGGSENRGPPIHVSQILFIKNKYCGVACPNVQKQKEPDRPERPGRQNHRSVVQKQNAMFKNTSQSCPVRAASAPEVAECCAKAKRHVQKHTTKLAVTNLTCNTSQWKGLLLEGL